jgi:hypothetical protein
MHRLFYPRDFDFPRFSDVKELPKFASTAAAHQFGGGNVFKHAGGQALHAVRWEFMG